MSKHLKVPVLAKDSYLAYLFSKHHVVPGKQAFDLDKVINAVVGVHSARLPSAYVAFHTRVSDFTPTDYRRKTYEKNHLIKLRCMRKTLHTVTQELAPIVHLATLELRVGELRSKLENLAFPLDKAKNLIEKIVELTSEIPIPHKQFLDLIACEVRGIEPSYTQKQSIVVARILLKLAWEQGALCYLNNSKHWAHEVRLYGNTRKLYPDLKFKSLSHESAVRELVIRYIRAFGPVSIDDIVWWSGIRVTAIRTALQNLMPELVTVTLEGIADEMLMTRECYEEYRHFDRKHSNVLWSAFLAYEDPTLKGYFSTRTRYVEPNDYKKLFNSIGEARPSVLLNGRVAGTWAWNRKNKRIAIKWFKTPTKRENALIEQRRYELERFLDESSTAECA